MENSAAPAAPAPTFESFGLRPEVLAALKALGYEEPTPIQRETIPALISGRDVLGQAATGTGKTAAFALPILERVTPKGSRPFETQALVLVPTRELAMQVAEAVQKYGVGLGVTAVAVYGGQEIFNQVRPLKRGVDVVVATPGRALDHIARKTLLLSKVKFVVLDEADEMLDMGFEDDLKAILNELPAARQTALFSATLPSRIAKIAEKHLNQPVRVSIGARALEPGTLPNIQQAAYVVQRQLKEAALIRVLEWENPQSALIFCRTRIEVEELTHVLMRAGYAPAALHGGLTQEQRDGVLKRFKEGGVHVLVATDVAARGLHVEALSHVVNFDLPTSPEVYVHRIGRTGRAGKGGVALSFLEPREMRLLGNVERQIKKKVPILQVPTRAQLDGKRSEVVVAKVRAALGDEKLAEAFKGPAAKASEGASMEAVAAAAMGLLHRQLFPPHDSDMVEFPRAQAESRRGAHAAAQHHGRSERSERSEQAGRAPRPERPEQTEGRPRRESQSMGVREGMTALKLSLGTRAGVRPQDLVGAIANEANLQSRQISGIRVDEFTSRVEVPTEAVERVIEALHATKIRGRKVRVEREGLESVRAEGKATAAKHAPGPSAPRAKAERNSVARAPRASVPHPRKEDAPARASAPRTRAVVAESPLVASMESSPPFSGHPEEPRFGAKAAKPRFGGQSDEPRFGAKAAKPRFGGQSEEPRFGAKAGKPRFGGQPEEPRFGAKGGKPRFGSHPKVPRFGGKAGKSSAGGSPAEPRFGVKPDKPRFGGKPGSSEESPAQRRYGQKASFDRPSRFASGSRPARSGRMEPKKR